MLKNYFKIAWRNLRRNKAYAAINVIGLSLGIACGILIFVLVSFHFSFDDFHKNKARIYRIVTEIHNEEVSRTPGVPAPFTKAFRSDFTFAEKTARAVTFWGELISIPSSKDNKKFQEDNGITCVEPEFFDIFDFPLVQGNMKSALTEPNTAIITQKIARKYFGTEYAMGKIIRVDNKTDFKITGIMKDIPLNTDRKQEIYVSNLSLKDLNQRLAKDDAWGGIYSETHCFILLRPGVKPSDVEKAFPTFMKKYYANNPINQKAFRFKLQPLSDIHFNPDYNGVTEKKYLWALSLVGLFLIITACVNFINLATAQALNRSKEMGIRKVLGSMRMQLFWQFIAETALITFFAILLAYGLASSGLPYLNGLFKTSLGINPFTNVGLLLFTIIAAVLVIFLSGAYPGLVLSGFQPVMALKGKLSQKDIGGFSLRRVLVVTQFAISQMLIIGTIVIASQMKFSKQSDLGFRKDAIVMLPVPTNDSVGRLKMETLRNRLAELTGVEKISFCMQAPASDANNTTDILYDNRPKAELWAVNSKDGDDQYIPTFDLKIVAGRNLYKSDTIREFLVNETFVRKLNLRSPKEVLNKNIKINGRRALVVGVVKDFYNYSFRSDIAPIAIFSNYGNYQNCAVKINLAQMKPTLASLEKIWNGIYPEYVYNYQFLDERIANFYELDDIMLKLIEAFAGIAIFIGCLGLYGLVSFMALQKTKEIGVRKVLGATVSNILWLFGKEFSRLLVVAFLIAAPLAWWAMYKYLEDFKYRIPIGAGIFVLAILATFIVAAITVGYKSIRASLANPVKSLRTE
ncbi:MAG TPA: ABC transporter permease [Puia sp.]|jgi:putative ABC transport system permease protein|nr:ABC transporter permease [Puia sp.]